ncbi:sporulation protein YunB [Clostridium beijerinckii]|uniref:Sporulation protein YunB n=1 Tax=Clostridium beijerinckii TaxID=1520 RepID=A0A9Q5GD30_CLOBE|nr:sporulation protein YunB [Clostridium beijerinckii]AQS07085.1 sporulation protein YunB [Clostridium beijerinckii]MBA2883581.1 sporulation protein YunB [Clostridium beijerinckii]MBA2898768.1 sporulation protein YunB [Clostridium beijerinckii]MBA2908168.1 sporulation protein YunB [Clostridium beijerinckii]MBA9013284.1 sporulation protein YunB [Clostridium beijerinckii]
MQYYTRRKTHKYISFIVLIIVIIVILNITVVFFDQRVMPSVTEIATIMAKSQTLDIINKKSVDILSKDFKYDEMVKIEKDNQGNIILIQADTGKLNYIAAELSTECNKELSDMKNTAIKVPLGWMSDKSAFYNVGPKISVEIEPIGNISTSYESKFESAGINQTRHKIYLNVTAKIRLRLPLRNQDAEVSTQVPVSDTIIVGKTPNTTLGFPTNDQSKSVDTN